MEFKSGLQLQEKGKGVKGLNKFKTYLCRNWKNGLCTYGSSCFFAHGDDELRSINAPGIKVTKCQQFHDLGYCQYGSRCLFIHREDSESINTEEIRQHSKKNNGKRLPVFLKLTQELLTAQV